MSQSMMLGPYLKLPEVTIPVQGYPRTVCPSCKGQPHRTGAFCSVCGTATVEHSPITHQEPHLHMMDVEEDLLYQPEYLNLLIHNHQNPHSQHLDNHGFHAIDLTSTDATTIANAIAWMTKQCDPVFAWYASQGLPAPTVHYGLVTYRM